MSAIHDSFIPDDGYTEPGYIVGRPGLYVELKFRFRPVLVQDQSRWVKGADGLQTGVWNRQCAALMAERVCNWSLLTPSGDPVLVTAASMLRLKPALFTRLYGILLGTEPSDMDPNWSEQQQQDETVAEVQARQNGVTVGETRQATNEKNSDLG